MKEVNTAYLTCPIRNVIDRFGDKWSLLVLYHLHKGGTLRFGQIYKEMSDVSEKMLSATLKNLMPSINSTARASTVALAAR